MFVTSLALKFAYQQRLIVAPAVYIREILVYSGR